MRFGRRDPAGPGETLRTETIAGNLHNILRSPDEVRDDLYGDFFFFLSFSFYDAGENEHFFFFFFWTFLYA